jgi:hypothetical protein
MSTDVIKLRLVNQSADFNNSQIVIFQKNAVANFDELAVAWKVIENLGHGRTHAFDFPLGLQVGATSAWCPRWRRARPSTRPSSPASTSS